MRKGIHCAGNFIIDYIKIIDLWPKQGMITNIEDEDMGTGGGPYNVLVDLAKMKVSFPLYATGMVGEDEAGEFIKKDLQRHGIDTTYFHSTAKQPTSYTLVMSEKFAGRTFFHHRGANKLLDVEHFERIASDAKIFYLGYLLLLDQLDSHDPEFGVKAARVLHLLKSKGYLTCLDMVTDDSRNYRQIVFPCLKYVDFLIINEFEAGLTAGIKLRNRKNELNYENFSVVADILFKAGLVQLAVIHCPEGGFAARPNGEQLFIPSYQMTGREIGGATGAGDAFCAGMLYGIHEKLALEMCLKIANANARFNLAHSTNTGGAAPVEQVLDFVRENSR
jgi:sugar/nucleoside kinase (ribokinase family)